MQDDDPTPATPTSTSTSDNGRSSTTETETSTPETPTATATATQRTETAGVVFLRESFDSAARSSVPEFSNQYGQGIIANGEFQLVDTSDDGLLVWQPWTVGTQDVSVQVRAFAAERSFTMACRDDGRYEVRATVNTRDQKFKTAIFDQAAGTFSTYVDWTATDAISTTEKSVIELICRGETMELVINGQTVASHTIAGTGGTTVWIAADGGVNANVFIDDIVIKALN
jgi:hypothetical protein